MKDNATISLDNETQPNETTLTDTVLCNEDMTQLSVETKKSNGLTNKQDTFALLVATGEAPSLVEAYIRSGYGERTESRKALRDNASQLAAKPLISHAIQAKREELRTKTHADLYASRRWILRRLREEANDMGSHASARIAALSLLAKASGALDSASERGDKRDQQTRDSLVEELRNRLNAIASANVIDVSPSGEETTDNALNIESEALE